MESLRCLRCNMLYEEPYSGDHPDYGICSDYCKELYEKEQIEKKMKELIEPWSDAGQTALGEMPEELHGISWKECFFWLSQKYQDLKDEFKIQKELEEHE